MNITLDQLRATIAVARTSSFSAAARTLRLTQPAVTRTIRTVEAQVGSQLFSRTTRRVELTTEGTEFVTVAQRIVDEYDNGLDRFAAYRRAESGSITIAALTSLAESILPSIVAEFLWSRPEVRVRLVTGTAPEVMNCLRTGQADIVLSEAIAHDTDLYSVPLGPDRLHAVVPAEHPLSTQSALTWRDLADFQFIALDNGTSVRNLTDSGFGRAGVWPQSTVTADSIGVVSALVAQGLGVSAFPETSRELSSGTDLKFLPLGEPVIERRLAIIASRIPPSSALAQAFAAVTEAARLHR